MQMYWATLLLLSFLLGACGPLPVQSLDQPQHPLKVGVSAGPHTEILYAVREAALMQGLSFEIVEFGDYEKPNLQLQNGEIDANSFQNRHFFERAAYDRNFDFVAIGQTIYFPMGIYSARYATLTALPSPCNISLPQEPMARDRAINLLRQAGFPLPKDSIPWQDDVSVIVQDRVYHLHFHDSLALPDQLGTSDLVVIHAPIAITKGLAPQRDSLYLEPANTSYTHLLVVRRDRQHDPALQRLLQAYHSDFVKSFILRRFEGAVLPAW